MLFTLCKLISLHYDNYIDRYIDIINKCIDSIYIYIMYVCITIIFNSFLLKLQKWFSQEQWEIFSFFD